jgi:hypothetical protein
MPTSKRSLKEQPVMLFHGTLSAKAISPWQFSTFSRRITFLLLSSMMASESLGPTVVEILIPLSV